MRNTTVIIGAGLTGLLCGFLLKKKGINSFTIFEQSDVVGGLCKSIVDASGYTFDCAGHFLHFDHEWTKKLLTEDLSITLKPVARDSKIFIDGNYCSYPFQINLYGMSNNIIYDCLLGYIEALETYGPPKSSEQYSSYGEWIHQTLGKGIEQHFMRPYNEKLWATDPDNMTTAWMKSYVPSTSLKDMLKGALFPPETVIGYNSSVLYPERGGIGVIALALYEHLKEHIVLDAKVTAVNPAEKSLIVNGEAITFENLVSTMPLKELAFSTVDLPDALLQDAQSLECASVFNINIGIKKRIENTSWIYVPQKEYNFFRMGFFSNFSDHMAPTHGSSVYIEIGYKGRLDKHKAVEDSIRGLMSMGFISSADDIECMQNVDMDYAYVTYTQNMESQRASLREWFAKHGIQSIGRYGSWEYSDMEDCFLHAEKAITTI